MNALRFAAACCALACLPARAASLGAVPGKTASVPITHVIIIMQENRTFDEYFGTFPGANGIPSGTCVALNPAQPQAGCVQPFHDTRDINAGGPHFSAAAVADLDNGMATSKMDGFVYEQTNDPSGSCDTKLPPQARAPGCRGLAPGIARHDVMGYHTAAEIPNYWAYAQNFVLQDQMYESVRSFSLDAHLYMSSEWSAVCKTPGVLSTCQTSMQIKPPGPNSIYPWVNLFQLMDSKGVSWKYYLGSGTEPDCNDDDMTCEPQRQAAGVLNLWNPTPGFSYVQQQGAPYLAYHNPDLNQFLVDIQNGTLPQVSWIVPSGTFSEHPPSAVTAGMEYVTSLVNAVMSSPYWQNTAIFIAWDDWGGFYDHVIPPNVDYNKTATPVQGYGLRVPGLLVSAYAKPGYIDHGVLSFDAYATFIEDLFAGGARLDPVAMGQPDNRPDVRDELTSVTFPNGATAPIAKLINEFNFNQTPLKPMLLSTHIPTGIKVVCGSTDVNNPQNCVGNSVTVSWDAVASGQVSGPFTYAAFRDGGTTAICTVGTTRCRDTKVPAGAHFYSVESIDQNNVVSPQSATSEADIPQP